MCVCDGDVQVRGWGCGVCVLCVRGVCVSQSVVSKLLLKGNGVTLLPFLVKGTSSFWSVTHSSL